MNTSTNEIEQVSEGQFEISTKLCYLFGVPIDLINKSPQRAEIYRTLKNSKPARIIRNLCQIRTDIMKNYNAICVELRKHERSILTMPELVSQAAIEQLRKDNVTWHSKSNALPEHHIITINHVIADRINNCKDLFPLWLTWEYVRDLFQMPRGYTKSGVRDELEKFRKKQRFYPYQAYLNWAPEDVGNIFANDQKIVKTIYHMNGDVFRDPSKVSDIAGFVKDSIYTFIADSKKLVIAVDCENADPYKLSAALRSLPQPLVQHITKIILLDDPNTGPAWKIIEEYTSIPIEYKLVERVTKFKSLVDTTLTATVSREFYLNSVDSFILVSSDSDYWGMISTLVGAKFLLMVERDQCGDSMKATLRDAGIFYCYTDDFYSGNCQDIKHGVILRQARKELSAALGLNLNTVLDHAISASYAPLSEGERKQFYDKYLKRISLNIDADGNVNFVV